MRFQGLLYALSILGDAAALAITPDKSIPPGEVIDILLRSPHLLSPHSYRMLVEYTNRVAKTLSKRDTSKIDPEVGKWFAAIPGGMALLESLQLDGAESKAPQATVKQIQESKGVIYKDAIRRKVRYGPYRVPPVSERNVASEVLKIQGVSNTLTVNVTKPCTGGCTVLQLSADLEYADGKSASEGNNAWLHHITLLNAGPNAVEPNCGYPGVESLFMSGNERSGGGFGLPGASIKSGYRLTDKDSLVLTTELMNMEDKEKHVWVTVTYELLDGPQPNYKQGKNVFLSIGPVGCGGVNLTNPFGPSNTTLNAQPKSLVLQEHSIPWKCPADGFVLSTGGHMHDGGVSTEIFLRGERICESIPRYGRSKPSGPSHSHGERRRTRRQAVVVGGGPEDNAEIEHILKQDMCDFPEGLPIKKGDEMWLKVNYDFNKHPGMKNKKGELDEIMGIVGTIIAF